MLQEVRPCKQQHRDLSSFQLTKEGRLPTLAKWRLGGIEAGWNDAGGNVLVFLALCIMLGWSKFNPNWCVWQKERTLPLCRALEGLKWSLAGSPCGQVTVPGDIRFSFSWALDEVRQETDKWPCLVNTAVTGAVITQQMGAWRNLYSCPLQSWRASGNRSCGGDCVCSYHLHSPAKKLSVWFVTKGSL